MVAKAADATAATALAMNRGGEKVISDTAESRGESGRGRYGKGTPGTEPGSSCRPPQAPPGGTARKEVVPLPWDRRDVLAWAAPSAVPRLAAGIEALAYLLTRERLEGSRLGRRRLRRGFVFGVVGHRSDSKSVETNRSRLSGDPDEADQESDRRPLGPADLAVVSLPLPAALVFRYARKKSAADGRRIARDQRVMRDDLDRLAVNAQELLRPQRSSHREARGRKEPGS